MRRPRAHHCERLTAGELRPLVEVGAELHTLADGTALGLGWRPVRGCFGNREGRSLLLLCPLCSAAGRVLWRPPGRNWGCWRCHPISHRSHRRSGSRAGRPKPSSWERQRIAEEQQQIAELLGLAQWPPDLILWTWRTLELEPRRPDAPRLSAKREQALRWRACALETLRIADLLPGIKADLKPLGQELPEWPGLGRHVAAARRMVTATGWAMRRPAGDPRTTRGGVPRFAGEITAASVSDSSALKVGPSGTSPLAPLATIGSVATACTEPDGLHRPRRNPEAPASFQRAGLVQGNRGATGPDPLRDGSPSAGHGGRPSWGALSSPRGLSNTA